MESNSLKIYDIVQGDTAVSTAEGNAVYQQINDHLKNNHVVQIDFEGINFLTTAFLNAALGQLYSNQYSSAFLNEHLRIKNVPKSKESSFEMVIKRAKEYFGNEKGFERSADSAIYGE